MSNVYIRSFLFIESFVNKWIVFSGVLIMFVFKAVNVIKLNYASGRYSQILYWSLFSHSLVSFIWFFNKDSMPLLSVYLLKFYLILIGNSDIKIVHKNKTDGFAREDCIGKSMSARKVSASYETSCPYTRFGNIRQ